MTAVYGIASAGNDGSAGAALSAFRTALVVPVVMVVLGALITALGLRRRKGTTPPSAGPVRPAQEVGARSGTEAPGPVPVP
ncbi:hypothetical protein ACVWXU_005756 [Streptomyces sp. TE33382]